jgi:BASS family bile acid:Na+ symporter
MGIVTDVILPLSLAFIMFSLGLGLSINDFTRVFFKPRDFLIGLFFQIIILPIVAIIIVLFWPLTPELAIGVMILAAAPGGVTSNVLTSYAKGNIALSISLTAINSILCVITVPIILIISLSILGYGSLNEGQSLFSVAIQMFLIVTVPVILGVLLSSILSSFEKIAKNISIILFALVLLGAILSQRENVINYFAQAGLVMLVLNIVMMIIVYILSKSFRANKETFRCWLMEVGLQNGTLAIVVANTFFASTVYLIPAAIYSLIMYATALPLIYFLRRN